MTTFDPVAQWARFVAACNERSWEAAEAMVSSDFEHVVVVGAVHSPTPARAMDKAALFKWIKALAERHGWTNRTHSIGGLGDTVAITYENRLDGGVCLPGYAIVRFDADGRLRQMYEVATAVDSG